MKRQIAGDASPNERARLLSLVSYGGNPEHKKNPGDFGLTPPSEPRADSTLCDVVRVFSRAEALGLLQHGICRGLFSERRVGGFPQNIWSMTGTGVPLEAQLENREKGVYHGYPLLGTDPFAEEVRRRWRDSRPCGSPCGVAVCPGERTT